MDRASLIIVRQLIAGFVCVCRRAADAGARCRVLLAAHRSTSVTAEVRSSDVRFVRTWTRDQVATSTEKKLVLK